MAANQYTAERDVVGAVMVVGGGIAGMRASLDLADAGYKVNLVEEQSAIGGHMARLEKTFPTNDCAMCTISPRMSRGSTSRCCRSRTTCSPPRRRA